MSTHSDEIAEIKCDIEPIKILTGEIFDNISISSSISPVIDINGQINDILELTGSFFLESTIQIDDINIPEVIDNEEYDGVYRITPSVNEQTLDTDKKLLRKDIIVEEIPTFWTQNITGMTFIIGD